MVKPSCAVEVSKQILVTHATKNVHTIGKNCLKISSATSKQRVSCIFYERSITTIIPNRSTDGAATQADPNMTSRNY